MSFARGSGTRWGLAGVALAAIAAAAVYAARHRPVESAADAAVAAPVGVTVANAERRDLALTFDASGRAEARASVLVKSRVDGQIAEVAFAEGRPVRKGQLLFRLDPAVFEAQVRQAEGVLARDQAQLAKLRADEERNQALARQGFISPSGLAQTQADLQAAQATLNADRAALDNAKLQLGFTRIEAPLAGIAGATQVPVGGAARANDTTLVTINEVQPLYITFPVPEPQLASLKAAMSRGPVRVTAVVPGSDRQVSGTLAFIDNAVDTNSGSITAKALFDNSDQALTPGQFATVRVQIGLLTQALLIPSQAVESGVDGPYVFVVEAGTARIRPLQLGVESSGQRVVTRGLALGDRVVTSGQARLRDKGRVSVIAATPPERQP
jgi:multidrug efflux system membrane fusion protein